MLLTLSDAVALKERLRPGRRLVIVGAGFVGAEIAATARGPGVEVTLLEAAPVPLALAVGEQVSRFLTSLQWVTSTAPRGAGITCAGDAGASSFQSLPRR